MFILFWASLNFAEATPFERAEINLLVAETMQDRKQVSVLSKTIYKIVFGFIHFRRTIFLQNHRKCKT